MRSDKRAAVGSLLLSSLIGAGIEMAGSKKYMKRVRCQVCSHEFDALFFKEDSDANDVEYCVVCGTHDFKFIEVRRKLQTLRWKPYTSFRG